jgi:asparagine synthase (glutamine-hydrolysing)
VAGWLRGVLKPWAEDLLGLGGAQNDGLFDQREIQTAWRGFQRGRSELALGLWAVLVFKAWKAETRV